MMIDPQDPPLCPVARTFATNPASDRCRGPDCAAFRWETITVAHPNWAASVKAVAAEIGDTVPFKKASRIVADDPEKYGLVPTRGFCGLGGQP